MGFTTPCFIRKNTANIRNRLKELGYYCNPYLGWNNLYTSIFGPTSIYSLDDDDINGLKEIYDFIDCGTNEELFLAIAALRDGTDKYMQWFTDGNHWYQNKISDREVERFGAGDPISYHKATVNELIEHFKTKEEQ